MKRHTITFFLDERGRIGIDSKGEFNVMEICHAMRTLEFSFVQKGLMGQSITKQFGAETFQDRMKKE